MNATHAYLVVEVLQVTAVVCAVLALMLCALRRSALRHALGVLGLGALLVSPVLTLVLPRPGWLPEQPVEPVAALAPEPAAPLPLPTQFDAPSEDFIAPFESAWPYDEDLAALPPMEEFNIPEEAESAAPAPVPVAPEPTCHERWEQMRPAIMNFLPGLLRAAGLLWIAGTCWFIFRWHRSHGRLRTLRESLTDWSAD